MASYTRQSTFSDGDLITAELFNDEYNQLLAAFENTTGHKHDGTVGEGPVISIIGDAGLATPLNKILIDTTNDHIEFWVDVSGTSTQQLYITDGAILPVTDNDIDLGSNSLQFKDLYINGTANIDIVDIDAGTIDGVTIGGNSAGAITGTTITATNFVIGSASINETELEILDGATLTTTELNYVDGVTSSIQTQIDTKAPLASPSLTGIPTAPTAASNTNTTQIATTAYVQSELTDLIDGAPGTLDTLNELAAAINDDANYNTTLTTALATKLPLAGGTMTGNVTYSDNVKAQFGTSQDLLIYHDGSNSFITDGGTGDLKIRSNKVRIEAPDSQNMIIVTEDAGFSSYYNGTKRLEVTNTGIDVTGTVTSDGVSVDGNINLGDNDSIYLGDSNDLRIYHDSGSSLIRNTTGSLYIQDDDGHVYIRPKSGQDGLVAIADGAVTLHHSGNAKLATTSSGIDVTGTVTSDGLTVDTDTLHVDATNNRVGIGTTSASEKLTIEGNTFLSGDNRHVYFGGGNTFIGERSNSTHLELRGGGSSAAQTVYIDNNGRLGLGTASPALQSGGTGIHVNGTSYSEIKFTNSTTGTTSTDGTALVTVGTNFTINNRENGYFSLNTNNSERLRVDSSGRLGIGTTSPNTPLDVRRSDASGAVAEFHNNVGYGIDIGTSTTDAYISSGYNQNFIFKTNAGSGQTERIRIDSSGNFLVGKTASDFTVAGHEMKPSSFAAFTRNGGTPLIVNRLSSDGDIIEFYKGTSSVGSIGTMNFGDMYLGTDDTGIYFNNGIDSISPINTTNQTVRDNAIDLGASNARFKDLYLSGTANFGSLSDGTITITGFVDEDNMSSNSATLVPTQQSVKAYVDSQVSSAGGNGISFEDNEKAQFGDDNDLQIYHDGNNSRVEDTGIGGLRLIGGNFVSLQSTSGENMVVATENGAVTLYHNNNAKLATTSTGIDVTGTVKGDGLIINGGATSPTHLINGSRAGTLVSIDNESTSTSNGLLLNTASTNANSNILQVTSNDLNRFKVSGNGDISFYDDTGSTQGLFWDASAEALGIGDTSPSGKLSIKGSTATSEKSHITFENTQGSKVFAIGGGASGVTNNNLYIRNVTDNTTPMVITDAGNATFAGNVTLSSTAPLLYLTNTTSGTGKNWRFSSASNGKLYITQEGVIDAVTLDHTTGNATFAGTITGDGLTVAGSNANLILGTTGNDITFTRNGDNYIHATGGTSSNIIINPQNRFVVNTGGSERLRINSSGRLGIKNSNPTATLTVGTLSSGQTGNVVINNEGGNTATLEVLSRTNRSILKVADNDTTGYISAEGGLLSIGRNSGLNAANINIDSSNRVGIGTTSPNRNLHIIGQYTVENSTSPSGAFLFIPSSDANRIYSRVSNASSSSRDFAFLVGSTEAMRIDSSGRVGIGISSPNFKLHLKDGTSTAVYQQFSNDTTGNTSSDGTVLGIDADGDFLINNQESKTIKLYTADTERVRINSAGSVGINTQSPSGELHIFGLSGGNGDVYVERTSGAKIHTQAQSALGVFGTSTNHGLAFKTNDTQRMRIDSSGNVGIGTSSPTHLLHVNGTTATILAQSTNAGSNASIWFNSNVGGTQANRWEVGTNISAGSSFEVYDRVNSASRMVINSSGNVGIGTTSPTGYKLVVQNTSEDLLKLHNSTDGLDSLISFTNPGGTLGRIQGIDNGGLAFDTGNNAGGLNSNAMFINNAGNVGIGTTSIIGKLHANDSAGATLTLTRTSGATSGNLGKIRFGNTDIDSDLASIVAIQDGATNNSALTFGTQTAGYAVAERMRIDSSGNVGIGTGSPSHLLSVGTEGNSSGKKISLYLGGTNGNYSAIGAQRAEDNTYCQSEIRFINENNSSGLGAFAIATGNNNLTERLRIDSSGRLGLGDTAPQDYLEINGSGKGLGGLTISNSTHNHAALSFARSSTATARIYLNEPDVTHTGQLNFQTSNASGGSPNLVTAMVIDENQRVGIGTTSPSENLSIVGSANTGMNIQAGTSHIAFLDFGDSGDTNFGGINYNNADDTLNLRAGNSNRLTINSSGNVGIGTTSPSANLEVKSSGSNADEITLVHSGNTAKIASLGQESSHGSLILRNNSGVNQVRLSAGGNDSYLLNSNLGIGTTSPVTPLHVSTAKSSVTDSVLTLQDSSSTFGKMIEFVGEGSTDCRGIIGFQEPQGNAPELYIANGGNETTGSGVGLAFWTYTNTDRIAPCDNLGDYRDNAIDLGWSSARFDDIYATNGTIQTSDRNDKQDIQALTAAETRVATACKGLLRKFRWQDAVTEKGDEARYHFGIIAQDLQDAFTAEGLDAGDYGMFISQTWEDSNEVEQTRLGVRYSELLAFIIAAI